MTATICPACEEHHITSTPRGAEHPTGWTCEGCGAGGDYEELGDPCPSRSPSGYICERAHAVPGQDETHRALVPKGYSVVDWWTS